MEEALALFFSFARTEAAMSAITATLPSASSYSGKVLFLKKIGAGSVTLKGTIIPAGGTISTTTTEHVGSNKSMMYISNGSAWIEYYCG